VVGLGIGVGEDDAGTVGPRLGVEEGFKEGLVVGDELEFGEDEIEGEGEGTGVGVAVGFELF
jgi:hypothetical protein